MKYAYIWLEWSEMLICVGGIVYLCRTGRGLQDSFQLLAAFVFACYAMPIFIKHVYVITEILVERRARRERRSRT